MSMLLCITSRHLNNAIVHRNAFLHYSPYLCFFLNTVDWFTFKSSAALYVLPVSCSAFISTSFSHRYM